MYYICCLCDSMDQEIQFFGGDVCDPVLSVTSPPGGEIQDSQFETPTGPFLGEQSDTNQGRKTLVLDLDETLVHSTFQPTDDCSYVIPVEIEGDFYNVYVYLRPGTTEFLRRMSEIYEVVVYTASLPVVRRSFDGLTRSMRIPCSTRSIPTISSRRGSFETTACKREAF